MSVVEDKDNLRMHLKQERAALSIGGFRNNLIFEDWKKNNPFGVRGYIYVKRLILLLDGSRIKPTLEKWVCHLHCKLSTSMSYSLVCQIHVIFGFWGM